MLQHLANFAKELNKTPAANVWIVVDPQDPDTRSETDSLVRTAIWNLTDKFGIPAEKILVKQRPTNANLGVVLRIAPPESELSSEEKAWLLDW